MTLEQIAANIKHERLHITIAWHNHAFMVHAFTPSGNLGHVGKSLDIMEAASLAVERAMMVCVNER